MPSEARAARGDMAAHEALFARMRRGRILGQRSVGWNLGGISGISRNRE